MKDKIHLIFKALFAQLRGTASSTPILSRVLDGFTTRIKMQFLAEHPSD
jgi:hypothetical protein